MRRRKVIGCVGALASYTVTSRVGATKLGNQAESKKTFASELTKAYIDEGKEGVETVFSERDLDFTIRSGKYDPSKIAGPGKEDSSDTPVGPNHNYDEDDSSIHTVVSESDNGTDRIWASAVAELQDPNFDLQVALGTPDIIGLSFNSDHWSVVGNKSLSATSTNDDDEPEASWHAQSLKDGGLAAEVDLVRRDGYKDAYLPEKTVVTLQTELRNLDDVPGNVFGTYVHTGGGNGSIDSVSGGVGPVSVSLSGPLSKTHFSIAKPADPTKYV